MVPLYAARVSDLSPGDFVRVECACGQDTLIPTHTLRLGSDLWRCSVGAGLLCPRR
jgi:hypothetical protein